MLRALLRSKLHRLRVTDRNIEYEGSLTIDRELLNASEIVPGERVQVVNINNGKRFETYIMEGRSGSGEVCVNGAAARLSEVGDVIIVIAYGYLEESKLSSFKPKIVLVDEKNRVKKIS